MDPIKGYQLFTKIATVFFNIYTKHRTGQHVEIYNFICNIFWKFVTSFLLLIIIGFRVLLPSTATNL